MFEFILILFGTFAIIGFFLTLILFLECWLKGGSFIPFFISFVVTTFFIVIIVGAIFMNINKLKENEANKKYEIIIGQVESLSKDYMIVNGKEIVFDGTAVNYLDYKDLRIDDVVACYYIEGYSMKKFIVKIDKIVQEGD